MDVTLCIYSLAPMVASSDSDEAGLLPLLLLLSGFIFYGVMYARYRNADKRHTHEKETSAVLENLTAQDALIKQQKGLRNAKMPGSNHARVEGSLNTGTAADKYLSKIIPKGKS